MWLPVRPASSRAFFAPTPRRLLLAVALAALSAGGGIARAQSGPLDDVHRMFPRDADRTYAVVLADADGDGDLDAVVGSGSILPPNLRLHDNTGAGVFRETSGRLPPEPPQPSSVYLSLAAGDVTGDGAVDLFLGRYWPWMEGLYINDGTGTFQDASSQVPPGLYVIEEVALADVDGDGDLDAWIADQNPVSDRLLLNDGTGIFTDASGQLAPTQGSTRAVALGDVDGDLDPDALLAHSGAQNQLFVNDGAGVFTDATASLPPDADGTLETLLADVDGDGDLDAFLDNSASSCSSSARDRLYLNDGAGVFTESTASFPEDDDRTSSVAAGDVDGDLDVDLLIGTVDRCSNRGHQNRLLRNDGTGVFADATDDLPSRVDYTWSVALGDVDGDGDLDALEGNQWEQNHLDLNDGAGGFVEASGPSPVPDLYGKTQGVALADTDGDGFLDVFTANRHGQDRLLRSDGMGSLVDATGSLPQGSNDSWAAAAGDLDGDGDADVVFGTSGLDRLYLNDGAGTFADATSQLPALELATRDLVAGDVDRDGDLDLVEVTHGGPDGFYRNDGLGSFSDDIAMMPAYPGKPLAVALGDVNEDGYLDVLIAIDGQSRLLLFRPPGGPFIDQTSNLPFDQGTTNGIATGDAEGDGDLDVFLANTNRILLWRNDGTGSFVKDAAAIPKAAPGGNDLVPADIERDGDLDLVVAGMQDGLLRNDGTGTFTDESGLLPVTVEISRSLGVGDLDGDLDPDAFYGKGDVTLGSRFNRVLWNRAWHLAWRGIPRLGKPLSFDVSGPPLAPYSLFAALAPAAIPLPFGTFRLDPSTTVPAAAGALDGQGEAQATLPVPFLPGLLGQTLFWQAVVGLPPAAALTNLEPASFTGL